MPDKEINEPETSAEAAEARGSKRSELCTQPERHSHTSQLIEELLGRASNLD